MKRITHDWRGRLLPAALLILMCIPAALRADDDLFVPGGEGDGPSIDAALSTDGRFIAFASEATNLVSDDSNALQDVFVRDRLMGDTERISLGVGGEEADGYSEAPVISADGRYVAFQSAASNLVLYDNNNELDVFVFDRLTAEMERVSVDSDGSQASGASFQPSLSADGRAVAFASTATNLDERDTTSGTDIYIHDRQTGQTELISVDRTGKQGAGFSADPSISADGGAVAFSSTSADLVADDGNDVEDVFVHDRQSGITSRVSVRSDGGEVFAESYEPALSEDGRVVAFRSYAGGLTDDVTNSAGNVYVHDRQTGATTLISRGADGGPADNGSARPWLSGDGRTVAFDSEATNLTDAPDNNNVVDVFLHDRQTGETIRLSVGVQGPGDNESQRPVITPDGRYVAFQSRATNLVADDTNGTSDVFFRDRAAGATERVSLAAGALEPENAVVYLGFISRE